MPILTIQFSPLILKVLRNCSPFSTVLTVLHRSSNRFLHKLVCLATFLKVSESDSFDPYQILNDGVIPMHTRLTSNLDPPS
ncbi:unnamed protein product [Trifolium pratense]|uniref:Uncharacterized protein n=1 Tax=Trifolium pratense TaxID=57577 RepID=A0ACB0L9D2_TRIPR|nr:unnamed protein product [Trifolium pratense]